MAGFQLAAVFSDHCVLQRDREIRIFGEATDGTQLCLFLDGAKACAAQAVAQEGRFVLELSPMPAGGPHSIEITDGSSSVCLQDVMIGEVYIAGGQSNMEFELRQEREGKAELMAYGIDTTQPGSSGKADAAAGVRFYYTQKKAFLDEEFYRTERESRWELPGEAGMAAWSAAGWYFAKELHRRLGITVGIIGCNWGGTSASCWMSREDLRSDELLKEYDEEYEAAIAGKSVEEQIAEFDAYEAYHAEWSKKAEACAKEDPAMAWDKILERCGECRWPGPVCCKNQFRPGGLYECMLQRIAPYTVRGVLWYQGESDDHKPRLYERLLEKMIGVWRRDFCNEELEFLIVQLPMHRYLPDPDLKNWPIIREAQYRICERVPHTRLILIPEYSMIRDIHPVMKKPLGKRLAAAALGDDTAAVPVCREWKTEGKTLRIRVGYLSNGTDRKDDKIRLYCRTEWEDPPCLNITGMELSAEELWELIRQTDAQEALREDRDLPAEEKCREFFAQPRGFEIAGEDKRFYPAQARTENGSEICLVAAEVTQPVYFRYAWSNFVLVNVFDESSGEPLMPFRNDSLEGEGGTAQIRQLMEL